MAAKFTLSEVVDTIRRKSIPEPNSGCVLWEGGLQAIPKHRLPASGYEQQYGTIRLRGKMVGVHRVIFEYEHGQIPAGYCVLHRCDVRICVNPAHLFLGTNTDNIDDKVKKDRGRKKLRFQQAQEIFALHKGDGLQTTELAKRFGVSQPFVSRLLSGKRRPAVLLATQE